MNLFNNAVGRAAETLSECVAEGVAGGSVGRESGSGS
ncbi:Uncharacterised protein [Mycobacteroides abscessus subsp. abscessus]|nr:Uncharacterised protein [Mycobacteroides abscessus subsp. abscessus]